MKHILEHNLSHTKQLLENLISYINDDLKRIQDRLNEGKPIGSCGSLQNTWNLFILAGEYNSLVQLLDDINNFGEV